MKKLEEYINLPYKVEIIKNADSTYFASIRELPGCMTEGDSIDEVYKMIEDAKKIWLETAIIDGLEIPEPEALQDKNYSGKLVLRIPKSLHKGLALSAEENEVSLNQYMNVLLSERHSIFKEKNSIINFLAQKLFEKDHKRWSINDRYVIPEDEYSNGELHLVKEN